MSVVARTSPPPRRTPTIFTLLKSFSGMMTAWRVIIIVAAAAAPAESLNSGNT